MKRNHTLLVALSAIGLIISSCEQRSGVTPLTDTDTKTSKEPSAQEDVSKVGSQDVEPLPAFPPGGMVIFSEQDLRKIVFSGNDLGRAKREYLTDNDGSEFVRVTNDFIPSAPWAVGANFVLENEFKKGGVFAATITARSYQSTTAESFATFNHEDRGEPYEKSLAGPIGVGPEWKTFYFAYTSLRDYKPGTSQLALHLGFPNQSIDIKNIRVIYYGDSVKLSELPQTKFTYPGMEPDAPWRKAAADRIEKHRKADFTITVKDAAGNPVPGASVAVKMTRHAFKFGTAVNADVLVNHLGKSADSYRNKVATLFNLATLENHHKYSGWIYPENRETANRAVDWLREKGLDIRGHVLVWPGWRYNPPQMRQLASDPEALRKNILDHITDIMTANKGKLLYWDVLNEPYTNHDFMDVLGKEAIVEWFKHAHSIDPTPRLFINDYSILTNGGANTAHQEAYFGYVEYLLQNGAPLHALGEQSHFGWLLTAPDRVMEILDRMASYGLPIHITELDINITDRELQAAYMRDYMTIVFSHPAVEGITLWGFWEGAHWAPDAAFWTRDWQLRPVGKAWLDLVHRDWKTDVTLETDQDGRATLRGFLGDYEVTVKKDELTKKITTKLTKNGIDLQVVLD